MKNQFTTEAQATPLSGRISGIKTQTNLQFIKTIINTNRSKTKAKSKAILKII